MKNRHKERLAFVVLIVFIAISTTVYSYKQDPPNNITHQFITNESKEIWMFMPYEIKLHLLNDIRGDSNGETSVQIIPCITENADYDIGDDIIIGSGEEDNTLSTCIAAYGNHFWDADDPDTESITGNDDYNDGLGNFGSSYRRALEFWTMNVIPNYLNGNINESYYWLGRVAHLLEDASQPSHVLLDPHSGHFGQGVSVLEDFSGNLNFLLNNYEGKTYENQTYNYENLIENFTWSTVQPTRAPDQWHIELFRLFWYTAQKTQYWASDDENGNRHYVALNGITIYLECGDGLGDVDFDLWADEGLSCGEIIIYASELNETTVEFEANYTIRHSMKAVAGLYRLFDDAVRIDWPTLNHDYRHTGYTLLKGDMTNGTSEITWTSAGSPSTDFWDDPVIAEIHNGSDEGMELIVATQNYDDTNGRVYALDGRTNNQLWSYNDTGTAHFPTVAYVDGDGNKEVLAGTTQNRRVYAINAEDGTLQWSRLSSLPSNFFIGSPAAADVDLDGGTDVIFADFYYEWASDAYVYAVDGNIYLG